MRKKLLFSVFALGALFFFGKGFAQSSQDITKDYGHGMSSKDTKFELASSDGRFSVGLNGYVQPKISYTYATQDKQHNLDMSLKRARIGLKGTAFDPRLTYGLQLGFESAAVPKIKGSSHYLRSYYFNWVFHQRYLQVQLGKFGVPFLRQHMFSGSALQFEGSNNVDSYFDIGDSGSDVGLLFHNNDKDMVEWHLAAVSSGVAARVGYNHNGIDGYDPTDWRGGNLRFAVGAGAFLLTDYMTKSLKDFKAGVDGIAKVKGFSANGAFSYKYSKLQPKVDATHSIGLGVDLGYLVQHRFEPVLRYSWFKQDEKNHYHEMVAGLNYYIIGNHLKIQAHAGPSIHDKKVDKWMAGVQFQFAL